jgi:hypothetical protein
MSNHDACPYCGAIQKELQDVFHGKCSDGDEAKYYCDDCCAELTVVAEVSTSYRIKRNTKEGRKDGE